MNNLTMKKRDGVVTGENKEVAVKYTRLIACAALLLLSFSTSVQAITFHGTGERSDFDSLLKGTAILPGTAMDGSATLPADEFKVFGGDTSGKPLNGLSYPEIQLDVLQEKAAGQPWDGKLLPDLNEPVLINLAAISGPGVKIPGVGTPDNPNRWTETGGSISAVPVPASIWLFGSALIGFVGFSRRINIV